MNRVRVFTNSTFNETIQVEKYLQPVTYHVVLGINFFADFMTSFSDFFGGRSRSYQSRLESVNNEVIKGIKDKTHKLGGNAVIDLKIDNDEISAQGKSMIMVTAIGTAVILKEVNKTSQTKENLKVEDALGAVNITDYKEFEERLQAFSFLEDADNLNLNSRLKKIDEKYFFDLLPEILEVITKIDTEPPTGNEEFLSKFHNALNLFPYEERSRLLFSYYAKLSENNEHHNFRKKQVFLSNLIIETNSVNYKYINNILLNDEYSETRMVSLIINELESKALFYKSDVEHLKEMKTISEQKNLQDTLDSSIDKRLKLISKLFQEE